LDGPASQQRQRRRYFERRRRAEAGADGNRAADSNSLRSDIVSGADQLPRHADHVIGPVVRRSEMREIGHGPISGFTELFGINAKPSVRGWRGDGDAGQVDGYRQDESQIVIGMFANQIDASRRAERTRHTLLRARTSSNAPNDSMRRPQ